MSDELLEENWKLYGSCFSPGSHWLGIVVRATNFGVFVELPGHLMGLLHISGWSENEEVEGWGSEDDKPVAGKLVRVTVLHVETDYRKIGVSRRAVASVGAREISVSRRDQS